MAGRDGMVSWTAGLVAMSIVALGFAWWSSIPSGKNTRHVRRQMSQVAAQHAVVELDTSTPAALSLPREASANGAKGVNTLPMAPAEVLPAEEEPTPQQYIDLARAQPRDDAWATVMERTLIQDLKDKADKLGFRLGLVECFGDSCTVEAFWNTLREARASFKAALAEPDHSRCAPRLLLSRSGNDAAPEMGVFVFDCKVSREREAVVAQSQN